MDKWNKLDEVLPKLLIKVVEPQHRFSAQLREVGHIEVRAPIGNEWDPETWNGDTWEDALGDLEFPGSPEPQGPAEVTPPPYEGGAGFVNEQDATSSSLSSERPRLPQAARPVTGWLTAWPGVCSAGRPREERSCVLRVHSAQQTGSSSGPANVAGPRAPASARAQGDTRIGIMRESGCRWQMDVLCEMAAPGLDGWWEHFYHRPGGLGSLDPSAHQSLFLDVPHFNFMVLILKCERLLLRWFGQLANNVPLCVAMAWTWWCMFHWPSLYWNKKEGSAVLSKSLSTCQCLRHERGEVPSKTEQRFPLYLREKPTPTCSFLAKKTPWGPLGSPGRGRPEPP